MDEEFTLFVRDRGQALGRTAFLLTGDAGRAEDLVQTALLALWLRRRRVANPAWERYVRRTMVNTASSWWRRRWSGERPTDAVPEQQAPGWTDTVDDRARLVAALRQLSARQRAAVVLRYYSDLSEVETAQVMGCSVGTVKALTLRGLNGLRKLLPDTAALDGVEDAAAAAALAVRPGTVPGTGQSADVVGHDGILGHDRVLGHDGSCHD